MSIRFLSLLTIGFLALGCKPYRSALSDVRVTNGKILGADEYPAVVPLYKSFSGEENQVFSCTGTFVTPRIALTAAHCVKGLTDENGLLKAAIPDFVFNRKAARVLRHPAYKSDDYNPHNDLGLVMFEEEMTTHVMKIRETEAKARDSVAIIGFGRHDTNNGESAGKKRIGFNTIFVVEDGLIKFDGLERGGDFSGVDAASAKGDSGGPMLIEDQIVGVTSSGYSKDGRKHSHYVDIHSPESRAFLKHAVSLGFDIPLPDSYLK